MRHGCHNFRYDNKTKRLTKEISEWNGKAVYGDIRELDGITNTYGLIHLDKEDIISVISDEEKNYLTSSVNGNLDEAFNEAINTLSCEIEKNSLLIDFRCRNKHLKINLL